MKLTRLIFKKLLDMLSENDKEDILLEEFNIIRDSKLFSIYGMYDENTVIYASNKKEATLKYIKTSNTYNLIYYSYTMNESNLYTCNICKQSNIATNGAAAKQHLDSHTRDLISEYVFDVIYHEMKNLKEDIII